MNPMLFEARERELDEDCRRFVVESLLLLSASSRASREILRRKKVYPIIREAERTESNDQIREVMHQLVERLMFLDDEQEQSSFEKTATPC